MIHHLKNRIHRQQTPARHQLLKQLLANQNLSASQLREKQFTDFTAILRHAITHVPYYREHYPKSATIFTTDNDIKNLPILRKTDVIQHRDELLADNTDNNTLRMGHTGGSTGQPLSFYYDQYKHELMRAGMIRSYMWSGWQPGEKILNFWGARQDIKPASWRKRWNNFISAEKTIGAAEYTEADLAAWVEEIKRYRPVLLQGYASILAELARFILDHKIKLPYTPKGIYSTAEMLHDWQRSLMESAFNCKVFNQYGCREVPNIAIECRHGNQHILSDMVYLESVEEDGEDKLIVTSLTNRLMPMIRYDIGDLGTLKDGECPCGSPFPMMEMSVCRSNDLIKTRRGKIIYPSYFIHLLDDLEFIEQYQFVQMTPDSITLQIRATRQLTANEQSQLCTRITNDIDSGMTLKIQHVDTIPRSRSGKHRFVIRGF
jgi:phenylacetate-CoA ligase